MEATEEQMAEHSAGREEDKGNTKPGRRGRDMELTGRANYGLEGRWEGKGERGKHEVMLSLGEKWELLGKPGSGQGRGEAGR